MGIQRGKFFTFEGIDGCGKSTQLARVAERLRGKGVNCLVTREPGGPAISERIREILIAPENAQMLPETELLLYLAARAQHVGTVIKPALNRKGVVLCDRFEQATYAYQGYGRGLDTGFLYAANKFATGGVSPDVTFIFDIPAELSMERLCKIGKGKDRIESEGMWFFERVREGYRQAAANNPLKIMLLDGTAEIGELTEIISSVIERYVSLI